MIVRIGDTVYSSDSEMIMLILTDHEKELLQAMGIQKRFVVFPEDTPEEEVHEFLSFGRDDDN